MQLCVLNRIINILRIVQSTNKAGIYSYWANNTALYTNPCKSLADFFRHFYIIFESFFDQNSLMLTLKFLSSGLYILGERDPTSEGPWKTYNNILWVRWVGSGAYKDKPSHCCTTSHRLHARICVCVYPASLLVNNACIFKKLYS